MVELTIREFYDILTCHDDDYPEMNDFRKMFSFFTEQPQEILPYYTFVFDYLGDANVDAQMTHYTQLILKKTMESDREYLKDYVRYVVPIHNLTQWLFCSRDGSFKETQTEIVELRLEKQKGKNI